MGIRVKRPLPSGGRGAFYSADRHYDRRVPAECGLAQIANLPSVAPILAIGLSLLSSWLHNVLILPARDLRNSLVHQTGIDFLYKKFA